MTLRVISQDFRIAWILTLGFFIISTLASTPGWAQSHWSITQLVRRFFLVETRPGEALARATLGRPVTAPEDLGNALYRLRELDHAFSEATLERLARIEEALLQARSGNGREALSRAALEAPLTAAERNLLERMTAELLPFRELPGGRIEFSGFVDARTANSRFLTAGARKPPGRAALVLEPALTWERLIAPENRSVLDRLHRFTQLTSGDSDEVLARIQALSPRGTERFLSDAFEFLPQLRRSLRFTREESAPAALLHRYPALARTRSIMGGPPIQTLDLSAVHGSAVKTLLTRHGGRIFAHLSPHERTRLFRAFVVRGAAADRDWAGLHGALLDDLAGLRVADTERALLKRSSRSEHPSLSDGDVDWRIHDENGALVFQQLILTPYSLFEDLIRSLNPRTGATFVDLGAAYGRMGLVIGAKHPELNFVGYEFVRSRAREASRVARILGMRNFRMREQNLAAPDFTPVSADYYFIYDYGSDAAIRKTLRDLGEIAKQRQITIVTRGVRTPHLLKKDLPAFRETTELTGKDYRGWNVFVGPRP